MQNSYRNDTVRVLQNVESFKDRYCLNAHLISSSDSKGLLNYCHNFVSVGVCKLFTSLDPLLNVLHKFYEY